MNTALRLLLMGGQFTPSRLFRAGEQGFLYINDLSTMYQDSAGTIPAAVDQPVGKWLDQSGRGNHATQATSANRPTLKQDARGNYYVHFNATNQWMQTAAVDFTGTDKMTVLAGVTKLSDGAVFAVAESSSDINVNNGAFAIYAPVTAASGNVAFRSKGTGISTTQAGGLAAPVSCIVSGAADIAADVCSIRVNGQVPINSAADQGAGTYGNYPVYIGARAGTSLFFNGDIYCLIARGALTTDSLIAQAARYINARMGGVY